MDIVPYAIVILPLLIATLVGLVRNQPWAFLGVWFFAIHETLLQSQPGNAAVERALLETRKLAEPD